MKADKQRGPGGRAVEPKAPSRRRGGSPALFAQCLAQGLSQEEAKIKAGYSPATRSTQIKRNPEVQRILKAVEDQRRELQQMTGTDFGTIAKKMGTIVTTKAKGTKNMDRIQAARVINDMMGYNAEKNINIKSQSLIMDLSSMSNASIEDFLNAAGISIAEAEVV